MPHPTRILILGGGFGGAAVARRLEQILGQRKDVEIALVDRENFSLFTPLLPEVPSGAIEAKHVVSPLRALLRRTNIYHADIKSIDPDKRVVVAAHCPDCEITYLQYDHLVLAIGSVTNFFHLDGVSDRALTVKSLADATALHAHVVDKFEHADISSDPLLRKQLLTFVIVGGGFAGVETAAELNDFVRDAGRYYPRVRAEDVRVILVHSGNRILPEVSESLSAYALRKLCARGVEVLPGKRIEAYQQGVASLSGGRKIHSRTLVWTAGIAANPLLAALDLPKMRDGRIEVEETLRVRENSGIWAVGDAAWLLDSALGRPYPPTAQHAIRQGRHAAENIAAVVDGRTLRPFRYRALGILVGLGRHSAVAEILGFRFSGFPAWWLWRTAYLLKLPGLERKVRVALDWTLDLFFPRDIVYLRSLHFHRGRNIVEPEAPEVEYARKSL